MLSRKGILLLGLGIMLVLFGPLINNLQLMLLGITLLGFVTLNSLVNTRPIKVRVERRFTDEKVFEGGRIEVDLVLMNRGRSIGFLEVFDTLPEEIQLVGGANHTITRLKRKDALIVHYSIECPLRGEYRLGPVKMRLQNPSFLFFSEVELEAYSTIVVLPAIEEIEGVDFSSDFPKMYQGAMPIRKLGTSGEFYAIREYLPGDDFKRINWKVFGRTRKLMVNQFEREDISDVMIVLDAREITAVGTRVRNPLVFSCRAAAALTNYFLFTRNRVGLIIYGDRVQSLSLDTGERHLYDVLTALAEVKAEGDLGLFSVMDTLRNHTPRSPIILISNLDSDDTAMETVREISARGYKLTELSPDMLEFEKEERRISPASYFTEKAAREGILEELRSLSAKTIDWNPNQILSALLLEVSRR